MTNLATYLLAGGDVTDLDGWELLVEEAQDALALPAARQDRADWGRRMAALPAVDTSTRERLRRGADLHDRPALARLLLQRLPEPERSAAFVYVEELRAATARYEAEQRITAKLAGLSAEQLAEVERFVGCWRPAL